MKEKKHNKRKIGVVLFILLLMIIFARNSSVIIRYTGLIKMILTQTWHHHQITKMLTTAPARLR